MVNTWQCFYLFFKACTKGYVVNSCLTLPLNTDVVKQWAIQLPASLTSYEHLGVRLCSIEVGKKEICPLFQQLWAFVKLSFLLHYYLPLNYNQLGYLNNWLSYHITPHAHGRSRHVIKRIAFWQNMTLKVEIGTMVSYAYCQVHVHPPQNSNSQKKGFILLVNTFVKMWLSRHIVSSTMQPVDNLTPEFQNDKAGR